MVILEKAVLHILDFAGGEPVLSAQELALEDGIREFLIKHVEKTIHSQDAKSGKFYENSYVFKCSASSYCNYLGNIYSLYQRCSST